MLLLILFSKNAERIKGKMILNFLMVVFLYSSTIQVCIDIYVLVSKQEYFKIRVVRGK